MAIDLALAVPLAAVAGGIASVVSAMVTVRKVNEWKRQRRQEERSQAAVSVLRAIMSTCDALALACFKAELEAGMLLVVISSLEELKALLRVKQFHEDLDKIQKEAGTATSALSEASTTAAIHVPDAVESVTVVQRAYVAFLGDVESLRVGIDEHGASEDAKAVLGALKGARLLELRALRERALGKLGPVARYEARP